MHNSVNTLEITKLYILICKLYLSIKRNSRERSFTPLITSYITAVQSQTQEISIDVKCSVVLCHFITCVDLCDHHHNQDSELGHQHKGLYHATPLWSHHPSPSLTSGIICFILSF